MNGYRSSLANLPIQREPLEEIVLTKNRDATDLNKLSDTDNKTK